MGGLRPGRLANPSTARGALGRDDSGDTLADEKLECIANLGRRE